MFFYEFLRAFYGNFLRYRLQSFFFINTSTTRPAILLDRKGPFGLPLL